MRKSLVVIFLLSMLSTQAQELNFWQKANNMLTKFKNIDSTYVYQPKQGFTLGLFSSIQRVGIDVTAMFDINYDDLTLPGSSKYSLREGVSPKIGLELGYGKLVLGYGVEVGPKRAYKKQAFGLNLLGKSWGLHFNYFNLSNRFKTNIEIGEEGQDNYHTEEILSKDPAKMECIYVDGYYAFNHKRFAYPAAYKAGLVQRRTAGSWMVTARYIQGKLYNSPDATLESYGLVDDLFTIQASVGGGYSANFVCWHKDPTNLRDKGLRNVTINLTALPVITAVNYLKVKDFEYDDEGVFEDEVVSENYYYPMPNFVGSTAIAMTLDRFFISTQFVYNCFYFRSSDAFKFNDLQISSQVNDLSFRGYFHDWKSNCCSHTSFETDMSKTQIKIITAIDSFKGCLTSQMANQAAAEGIKSIHPGAEIVQIPVSDGGEGFIEAFHSAIGGDIQELTVNDPLMRPVVAHYLLKDKTAVIEIAQASGLPLLTKEERNPLVTTSYGTGELVVDAVRKDAEHLIVGLGGSATSDAGIGMIRALVDAFAKNGTWDDITELKHVRFTIASDVKNPLYGENGAAHVFGPQKGATPEDVLTLDKRAKRFAEASAKHFGYDRSETEGAGAAGGLGYAFLQYLDAECTSGIRLLLQTVKFEEIVKDADLVITGEGSADRQTLMGKLPIGILEQSGTVPVCLIAGRIKDREQLLNAGFAYVECINPAGITLEEAMREEVATQNIHETVISILKTNRL